jgi:DNA primase
MIDQATIDRILDAAQIVDVVSEFVTLRRRGVNYIGLCPFHNEKTPSFSVSPSKGLCKCFSCGKGGNVVHFIMEHEQLTYYEALKWLARKYNIEIKERELTDEEKQAHSLRESLFVVNQYAAEYFQDILYNNIDGQRIGMTYLRGRGFRDDIIKKFQLGYSTDSHDALAKAAIQKGYKADYLVKTGLCYRKDDGSLRDRFWGRVIFPVHTLSGKVVAFGGRVLNAATKNVQMKYVNSPESEIYHKSRELYGIYFAKQAIVRQDRCFLVEGYTDVISMHQSGIENVVASSGTALTAEQIRMIHRFTNNITVLYDGDGAGIKASIRGLIVKKRNSDFRTLRNRFQPAFHLRYDDYTQYVPLAATWGLKLAGLEGRSSWKELTVSNVFSAALMAGFVNALKYTTKETRPDNSSNNSFPSGHTATAFMCATILHKEYGMISP